MELRSEFKWLMVAFTWLVAAGITPACAATAAYELILKTAPTNSVAGAVLNGVMVQLADKGGTNVAQGGTAITIALNKNGALTGITNLITGTNGNVSFTNLQVGLAGSYTLTAGASGLKSATSAAFTIAKGGTTITLASSTNILVYGQNLTLTAHVAVAAPASGTPSGTVTFKDGGTTLGMGTLNGSGLAIFNTNKISAATASHTLTAVYGGDTNFLTSTSSNLIQAVAKLALTVSGVQASNKIYDGTTNATLIFSNATLAGILFNDAVTLNTGAARGFFADKNIGNAKGVGVSGVALTGAGAGNYSVVQPVATANITARSLALTAKGANKIYDGTTNAAVTLTDNRVTGDVLTDSYAAAGFANKNVGTNILINVYGLAIAGTDSANYTLSATNTTASANITKAALTVSGIIASNKIYDATTTATLNFSNATLATLFAGDTVMLNTSAAKGVFASKVVGIAKAVAISGLTLGGSNASNYSVTQPTTTANITARSLALTAKGVNKIYDGTTNATVTLTDNRVAGDVLTDNYASAGFTNKNVGTNILINFYGLAIAGTDSANYTLSATNTTASANIMVGALTVAAVNISRPYATTNPMLSAVYSGFVAGESLANSDLIGSPVLTTIATTNSPVGSYPITIAKGTLASVNYTLKFTNGVLAVTKADTTALLSTTLNPAHTNQNITFAAKISPLTATVLPPTGNIQFKSNGTNKLGNAIPLSSGLANVTILAATLGQSNSVITAEYSDPAGNFNSSTNSLTQSIVTVVASPPPSKLSLAPSFGGGNVTAQLSGVAGQTYIIQASTDLIHWISFSTNVADASGGVSLVDTNAVAYPSRFYRAFSP